MESDDWEEIGSVKVPASMIRALTYGIMQILDKWHESREMDDYDIKQCVTAITIAASATIKMMSGDFSEGETIQ